MPHEEQFGPERLVHGHEGIERIESRIVRELLAIAHGRVKRLEVLDAVRTRMLEHEAGLLGLAELPPPGLAKALALFSVGKAQFDEVAIRKAQDGAAPEAAVAQCVIFVVPLARRCMRQDRKHHAPLFGIFADQGFYHPGIEC